MENKRKYKQYLYDSKINMPARTYYSKYQKKKKESTSTNETLSDLNNTFNNNETIQQESQITSQNENIQECLLLNEYNQLNEPNHLEDHHHTEESLNENKSNDSFTDEMNILLNDENISEEDLAAAYLTSFYNGRVSQKSLKDFLAIGNFRSSIKLPTSYDGLISLLNMNDKKVQYEKSWFCSVCQTVFNELDNRFQRLCAKCKTTRLTMYYHLNIESQIQNIMNKLKLKDLDRVKLSNDLTDFTDGRIYQKILESEDGHLFKKKQAFSCTINTDGISVSNKSKLTIWPV